jgi:hypothetical protein
VAELHLDERIQSSREVIGKHIATGQKKVSTAFNNLWNDIEAMREAQRRKAAEERAAAIASGSTKEGKAAGSSKCLFLEPANLLLVMANDAAVPRADLTQTQATLQAASQRAGAYLSSWGTWAAEKRKTGWGRTNSGGSAPPTAPTSPVTQEKREDISLPAPKKIESKTEAGEKTTPTSEPGFSVNGDREDRKQSQN